MKLFPPSPVKLCYVAETGALGSGYTIAP